MEEQIHTPVLKPRFDVRKLVGQTAYWDGSGAFLVQHPQKTDGLKRLQEALMTDGIWRHMREGLIVDVHKGDALTVHFADNDFGVSNVVVPYGQYLLVY